MPAIQNAIFLVVIGDLRISTNQICWRAPGSWSRFSPRRLRRPHQSGAYIGVEPTTIGMDGKGLWELLE